MTETTYLLTNRNFLHACRYLCKSVSDPDFDDPSAVEIEEGGEGRCYLHTYMRTYLLMYNHYVVGPGRGRTVQLRDFDDRAEYYAALRK